MNPNFEQRLGRVKVRPVPPEWRAEILCAAQAQIGESRPFATPVRWWREWFWPNPQAWLGVAAAWVVIFVLQATSPDLATSAKPAQMNWQSLALMQLRADDFSLSGETIEPPRRKEPDPALRPRTSRNFRIKIG